MKTGAATIKLRDGRVYVAELVKQTTRGVSFIGCQQVTDVRGPRLYAPTEMSVTPARVERIDWDEAA